MEGLLRRAAESWAERGTKPRSWHDIELSPFSPHSPLAHLDSLSFLFLILYYFFVCFILVALGLPVVQPFSSCDA